MAAPDVLGIHEIGIRLGVGRSRASQLVNEPDFPEPARLIMGRVWDRADVERWIAEHRPETERDA